MPAVSRIDGLEETVAMLDRAPKQIVASGYVRALDAAGQVFVNAVWPKTPIHLKAAMNRAHGGRGALITGLDAFVTIDSNLRGGVVEVGFGSALGHIANWVEFGHRLIGPKPGKKYLGEVRPHPFMRPAFASSAERAIDVFAATLKDVVTETFPQR